MDELLETNKEVEISIILPIYNVEKYLPQTIKCLQDQSFQAFEVVMIDDGSTDNSTQIAVNIAQMDKRFKYYRQENSGLSASRNAGFRLAEGKYILYLDSDDTLELNTLEELYTLAEVEMLDLIVFSGVMDYYDREENKIIKSEKCGNQIDEKCDSGRELYKILRKKQSYFTGAPFQFVRKSVLRRNQILFYEGILHEDHLYTFQLINSVGKCAAISNKYYHYRMRPGSITKGSRFRERFTGFATTFCEMYKWSEKNNVTIRDKDIEKHINEIWIQTIKYIAFMSEEEIKTIDLHTFIYTTKEYYGVMKWKHYWGIYYPILRMLHYTPIIRRKLS